MSDDKLIESVIYPVRELASRLDGMSLGSPEYRETRRNLLWAIVEAGIDIEAEWRYGSKRPPEKNLGNLSADC